MAGTIVPSRAFGSFGSLALLWDESPGAADLPPPLCRVSDVWDQVVVGAIPAVRVHSALCEPLRTEELLRTRPLRDITVQLLRYSCQTLGP